MYTSGNPLKDFWMHCPWICPLIGKCSMTHPPPRKNPLILKLLLRLQKSVQRQSEHSYNCSLDRSIIGRWMCKFTIAIITFSSAKLWKVIIVVMSDRWTMGRMDRQIDGPLDRWTMGRMDRQIDEPWDEWTIRSMNHEANGLSDRWTMGQMDRQIDEPWGEWTVRSMNHGANGPSDRWTMGQMDRQIIGSSNYSYDPFRRYQV